MPDLMISYAREDLAFVVKLCGLLKRAGRESWVDLEGIFAGEEWWPRIQSAIEGSDNFVFVISPHSAASTSCRQEVEHAERHGKRIIPIVLRDVDAAALPQALRKPQWLFFQDSSDGLRDGVHTLIEALDLDPAWVHSHTRLLVRAREWESSARIGNLLAGDELAAAREWVADREGRVPAPTELHIRYIDASADRERRDAEREARMLADRASRLVGEDPELATLVALAAIEEYAPISRAGHALWTCLGSLRLRAHRRFHGRVLQAAFGEDDKTIDTIALGADVYIPVPTVERPAIDKQPVRLRGHSDHVSGAVFSHNRQQVLTGGHDSTIRVWDTTTGRELAQIIDRPADLEEDVIYVNHVWAVAWSPDSRRIASADNRVHLWDARTGRELNATPDENENENDESKRVGLVRTLVFSPDARCLVAGDHCYRKAIASESLHDRCTCSLTNAGDQTNLVRHGLPSYAVAAMDWGFSQLKRSKALSRGVLAM